VPRLGGDDLDEAILRVVLERSASADPRPAVRRRMLDECRTQKEAINPNTRRIVVEREALGLEPLVLPIDDVYAACLPIVQKSLDVMDEVMRDPRREADAVGWNELAGIYVVGGASSFPLVYRHLRERFGQHRVRRSPHPFAATAIGLATFVDEDTGYELADCLSRHFGVWREADRGHEVAFDPIFPKDTRLPRLNEPPLQVVRRYRPAHNLGHFRYVECGRVRDGVPDEGLRPWDEIRFPFDPTLRSARDLKTVEVRRLPGEGPEIEERYRCTAAGTFEVTLAVLDDGFEQTYRIANRAGGR
jgi:molecular chaperone DnaK (HSP70)